MSGIEKVYKLKKTNQTNWTARIEDWGNLFLARTYLPNGKEYNNFWNKSLLAAKIMVSKELEIKNVGWELELVLDVPVLMVRYN